MGLFEYTRLRRKTTLMYVPWGFLPIKTPHHQCVAQENRFHIHESTSTDLCKRIHTPRTKKRPRGSVIKNTHLKPSCDHAETTYLGGSG